MIRPDIIESYVHTPYGICVITYNSDVTYVTTYSLKKKYDFTYRHETHTLAVYRKHFWGLQLVDTIDIDKTFTGRNKVKVSQHIYLGRWNDKV